MDLHKKPFDEGTLTKLDLFEAYAKEWLPVFIMKDVEAIWIFDCFAGTGVDIENKPGSPIRILRQILGQAGNIFNRKSVIYLIFNEYDKEKFAKLQESCSEYILCNSELKRLVDANKVKIKFLNQDFDILFPKAMSIIKKYPSLVFLDQNGIKFLDDKYFLELTKARCTDFLYFVSSSYFLRFGNQPEFKSHFNIDFEQAKKDGYKYIHRNLIEQLRGRLPKDSNVKLYPFTIKKGANIYGIIFGASHPKAVDKFLKVAWEKNHLNGTANFDIDSDISKCQLDLFSEQKLTKIQQFQENLKDLILSKRICTNKDAYDYTLSQGHINSHADEIIKSLKKQKMIDYDARSPLCTYEQVYKNNRIIEYKVL